jgi:hypothetical protein
LVVAPHSRHTANSSAIAISATPADTNRRGRILMMRRSRGRRRRTGVLVMDAFEP